MTSAAGATATHEPATTVADSMAKANRAFDYTHLGRDGADYFAKIVTDEVAIQVPSLRRYLVP